ncbi:MAG: serine/threonine protein kinase/WD40 repeat protein [Planctomycetota bacterium]|jgi:serine/threonine protein kinase/WD40 repeat protein
MSEASHAELQRLFFQACALAHGERTAFLDGACAGNGELRAQVEGLLSADAQSEGALDVTSGGAQLLAAALDEHGELAEHQPALPERIGSYRVLRELARGGMGIVYVAEQDNPRRRVALKIVRQALVTGELLQRFRREARLLGLLHHPGIAQIYEANTYQTSEGMQPFLVMELVDGVTIDEFANANELDSHARLELIARLCDAVHYAHQKGVVHRDLKPDNILVTREALTMSPESSSPSTTYAALPQPKILDFGVARALETDIAEVTLQTTAGELVGTVPYMSPEQASGDPEAVDELSDVYALGLIAYELLAGCLPYEVRGKHVHEAVRTIQEDEPSRLGTIDRELRGDVETIVAKALEKEKGRRYVSASEMAADIRRFISHQPIEARPASTIYQLKKFARRNKVLVGGALATLSVAIVGAVVSFIFAGDAREQRDAAIVNATKAANGILQSTAILTEVGREQDAIKQLRLVPEEMRAVAWRLLDRGLPHVVDGPPGIWRFQDDEHIVPNIQQTTPVYSLLEQRTAREFASPVTGDLIQITRSGIAAVRAQTGFAAESEILLVDLEQGIVLDRSPNFTFREEVEIASGREGAGQMREEGVHRWPDLSQDGRTIVWYTSSSTAEVRVDGSVVRVVEALGAQERVRIGPDGRLLVENRCDMVTVTNLESGELRFRHSFDPKRPASGRPVRGGVLLYNAPDHQYGGIIYKGRSVWRLFEIEEDVALVEPDDPFATGYVCPTTDAIHFSYSLDGRIVAVTGFNRQGAFLGSTETGVPLDFGALTTHPNGAPGWLPFHVGDGIELSPSGRNLLLHSNGSQVRVIELDPREDDPGFDPRGIRLRGHSDTTGAPGSGWIYHVALSADGSLVASSAPLDPYVRVWDARTGDELATLQRNVGPRSEENPGSWESLMAFGSDDQRLVLTTPFSDKGLCVVDWDLATSEIALPVSHEARDQSHLLLLDRFIDILAPSEKQRLSQRVQMMGAKGLAIFEPPTRGARGMQRPSAGRNWSYVPGVEGPVVGLGMHPTLALVAVVQHVGEGAAGMGTVSVIDQKTGEVVVTREFAYQPWCVAFSPDGGTLAIGTHEGRVVLFETELYSEQLAWRAHEKYIYSIAWTPDGTRIVTASGDETLGLWDTRSRAASRLAEERWIALRAQTALREDLSTAIHGMQGEERQAARIELIRMAHRK